MGLVLMHCLKCAGKTVCSDSRPDGSTGEKRRRRRCVSPDCGYRFSTVEIALDELGLLQKRAERFQKEAYELRTQIMKMKMI